ITPKSDTPRHHARFSPERRLSVDEMRAIAEGDLMLYVCGFIEYRDVFDKIRLTRFRYLWTPSPNPIERGTWGKIGPAHDNIET
ncbi:MAG: hypothetical protein WAN97_00895, partial [Candidatus Acidiferrales bacterium]